MSIDCNAYRQSMTDRKSVASDKDGLIKRNKSLTSLGPLFNSVSTLLYMNTVYSVIASNTSQLCTK